MENNNFCPFLSDSCRSDCVFYHPVNIYLRLENITHCCLGAFASVRSKDEAMQMKKQIKKELNTSDS